MSTFGVSRAPRLVFFGVGQRHALPRIVRECGQRAFICSDARFQQDPMLAQMARSLAEAGIAVEVYDETIAELPLDCVEHAAARAAAFRPDVVVGIGGGSCLDIAKLVAVRLSNERPLSEFYGEFKVPGPVTRVIAVPTTSGTGSEVTPVAVLADPARDMKIGISSPYLIPDVAICDPELTLSCPRGLTAIAGADAMTHAIEAFTAARHTITPQIGLQRVFVGKNAISDMHAREAIRGLAGHLRRAVENGSDIEARAQVMFGALQAGMAFSTAGTAAAHAIQYPVGAATHTAHGLGVASLLPYVMEFNLPRCVAEFAEIARVFGVTAGSDDAPTCARKAIDAVAQLFGEIGIPDSLGKLGLEAGRIAWVAEQAMSAARLVRNNPRELDEAAMRQLVEAAFAGDRVALRG